MNGGGLDVKFTAAEKGLVIEGEHDNLGITIIRITEDKLKLCINEYSSSLNFRSSWQVPLTLVISLLLAVITTTSFKDALGVTANVWNAVFLLCLALSSIWLVVSIYKVASVWKMDPKKRLIGSIKASNLD